MEEHKDTYPASLSGGEKQRVAISRAIIHEPSMLFADEPTASLDSKRSKEVMQLIQELTRTLNITTLLVTHEEEMLQYADQDRKSTRLNSSHVAISYTVFCL